MSFEVWPFSDPDKHLQYLTLDFCKLTFYLCSDYSGQKVNLVCKATAMGRNIHIHFHVGCTLLLVDIVDFHVYKFMYQDYIYCCQTSKNRKDNLCQGNV